MANNESLLKLKQKRTTHKAQITNFNKFLEEYKKADKDLARLTLRLDKFKASFMNFDTVSDDLEMIDSTIDHQTERFRLENLFLDLVTDAEKLKGTFTINTQNSSENASNSQGLFNQHKRRLKLPEASLPRFNGKYEDWLSFNDAFVSMIDNQPDLTNVEKLQYLKSVVTDEAANKIKHLSITDDNYSRAWKLLESAYADKRLIISRHLSLLLRLPVQEKESAEGLRRMADETQQHLESLKTLKINVGEEIVVQILEEKLHKFTAEKWEETLNRDSFPKLPDMIAFLYKAASRISRREIERPESSNNATKSSSANQNKKQSRKSVKQAFVSQATKNCLICQEQHPIFKCEKFRNLSIPKRVQAIKDASLCLNCLRNHGEKPCNFGKCMICNESHNTLLHDKGQD